MFSWQWVIQDFWANPSCKCYLFNFKNCVTLSWINLCKKMFAQLLFKISSWLPLSLWVSFYDKSDNNARPNLFSLCHVIKNIYTKQNYLKFNLKLTSKLSSHNFLSLDHIQMINYWDLRDCYSIHIANKGRLGFAFLVHQSVQVRARHHSGKGGCQI